MNLPKYIEAGADAHRKRQRDIADCLDQRQCEADYIAGAQLLAPVVEKLRVALDGTLEMLEYMGASSDAKRIRIAEQVIDELERLGK